MKRVEDFECKCELGIRNKKGSRGIPGSCPISYEISPFKAVILDSNRLFLGNLLEKL